VKELNSAASGGLECTSSEQAIFFKADRNVAGDEEDLNSAEASSGGEQ